MPDLTHMPHVVSLDMSNNLIEELSAERVQKLHLLKASNNRIKTVLLKTMPHLEFLDLSHNDLKRIYFNSLQALKELCVEHNPLLHRSEIRIERARPELFLPDGTRRCSIDQQIAKRKNDTIRELM